MKEELIHNGMSVSNRWPRNEEFDTLQEAFIFYEANVQSRIWRPRIMNRPDARKYENRQDYLMRVADENRLNGIAELCRVLKTDLTTLLSLPDGVINKFFSGVPLELIAGSSSHFHGSNGHAYRRGQRRTRVCPQCIEEGLPLSVYFDVSLPIPCPRHQIMPIDFCPVCANPVSYQRKTVRACDCGFNWSRSERVVQPQWMPMLYSLFAPWHLTNLPSSSYQEIGVRDVGSGSLIRLLVANSMSSPTKRRRVNSWISLRDFDVLERFVVDWPRSLRATFSENLIRYSENRRSHILKLIRGCGSSLLQLEVANLIRQYREERILMKKVVMTGSPNAVSLHSLRLIAKLDAAATCTLLQMDLKIPRIEAKDGKAVPQWVDEKTAQLLKDYFTRTIDLAGAATILGCTKGYVRALVKCGWLNAEVLFAKPRSPRFKLEVVETWLGKMRTRAFPLNRAKAPVIPLSHIPAYSAKSNVRKSWEKIFQAIMDERVLLFVGKQDSDLSQIHVQSDDLLRYGMREKDVLGLIG